LRCQPGSHRADVGQAQASGDGGHAIGRAGMPAAIAPGAELGADIVARQAEQAGNGRCNASQCRAMARRAGRQIAATVPLAHQLRAARQDLGRDGRRLRRRVGWMQCRKIGGDFLQVGVRLMRDHVDHERILAPPLPKIAQLIVEIAGRLAGDARIVAIAGRAAILAVAGGAGKDPLGQSIGHHERCLGCSHGRQEGLRGQQDGRRARQSARHAAPAPVT
jgi:hypothetical protein